MDEVERKRKLPDDPMITNPLDVPAGNSSLLGTYISVIRGWSLFPADKPTTLRIQFDGPINLQEHYKEEFQKNPKFLSPS